MKDPYLYDDCDVLKNKFGYKSQSQLDDAEADWVALRIREIAQNPLKGCYDYPHFLQMHYYFFQDIYEWAGQQRVINIFKEESVLGGLSIEYSDTFDIAKDAKSALKFMKSRPWKDMSIEEQNTSFCEALARLWKVHCFREGNTRTAVTFCCQYADDYIAPINRKLLEEHSDYVRTALVAYNACFSDGSDFAKKHYLEQIMLDAFGARNS